jgi:hypothetical protein
LYLLEGLMTEVMVIAHEPEMLLMAWNRIPCALMQEVTSRSENRAEPNGWAARGAIAICD